MNKDWFLVGGGIFFVLVGVAIFLGTGWAIGGTIDDMISTSTPKIIKASIPIENLPANLPRDVKYFSVFKDYDNNKIRVGYLLERSSENYSEKIIWNAKTDVDFPGSGFTKYKPAALTIEDGNLLVNFEHAPEGPLTILFYLLTGGVFATLFILNGYRGFLKISSK